ncbi:hypothetical protein BKA70DRAFT_1419911 [Coprinopsis sp. MPI-PUGE-AT-0042]|nr:hypothetical protein BKA70DRAFT_1419911 [Coprinopsis sp. MPI-PUGE-AT-0042]
MASSKPIHPCLPEEFLEKLREDPSIFFERSHILDPRFEKFRTGALKLGKDRTPIEATLVMHRPDSHLAIEGGTSSRSSGFRYPQAFRRLEEMDKKAENFRQEDDKTLLHYAAATADVPLAYEVVRMGMHLDHKDQSGITALFLAVLKIAIHTSMMELVNALPTTTRTGAPLPEMFQKSHFQKLIACNVRIATMLVEQHADVNAGAFNETPLSLAAQSGSWSLVELFLLHGARRTRADHISFRNTLEKSKYSSLLVKAKALLARPTRPCPCWSGKLLDDCHDAHGAENPWPAHFLCCCGRKRTYSECCGKRGIEVVEEWDSEDKWIMPVERRKVRMQPSDEMISPEVQPYVQAGLASAMETMTNMNETYSESELKEIVDSFTKKRAAMFKSMAAAIGREDCFDDAFWYALDKTDFFPRPWEKVLSKVESRKRMNEWNTAVDEYLKTEGRFRDRFTVEYEAKIGLDGCPLYKTCSAKGCGNIEKQDVPTLMKCSGCGLALYCSRDCQRNSWKDHRKECKAGTVQPQQSESQWQLEALILVGQGAQGMRASAGLP